MGKKKKLELPEKNGWYWVRLKLTKKVKPCLFFKDEEDEEDSFFLAGGMGDASRNGLYSDDIESIGPEIIEPEF